MFEEMSPPLSLARPPTHAPASGLADPYSLSGSTREHAVFFLASPGASRAPARTRGTPGNGQSVQSVQKVAPGRGSRAMALHGALVERLAAPRIRPR
jgi:hypothetical protein